MTTSRRLLLAGLLASLAACGGTDGSSDVPPPAAGPAASADSGAGSTGGSGTGSSSGAGGDAGGGGSSAPCSGDDVCLGFEPGAPAPVAVSPNCSGTGEIALDSSISHSGTGSLRVDGKAGYCNHVFWSAGADVLGTLGDRVNVRFFVRMDRALGPDHVTFLASHDDATGKDLRMGGQKEILMWNREMDDATLPDLSPTGTAASRAPTAGAWTCVSFTVDRAAGTLTTSVDGATLDALSTGDGNFEQQWSTRKGALDLTDLRLGWESYGNGDMTLWFDDVAISRAPLPCP